MEDSNYYMKAVGLDSYIGHAKNFCGSPNNLDYNHMEPEENVQSEKANVEADDFFSSLELQSSSKMSSTMLGLNFPSKFSGGIVTRSRSYSSTVHETPKTNGKIKTKPKTKWKAQRDVKKKKSEKTTNGRKAKKKVKSKYNRKSPERRDKGSAVADGKKQNRLEENGVEKGLGFEKVKDENDWVLFNQSGSRKETYDKLFEGKHVLSHDLPNPIKRTTPELFSMSSILMSDAMSEGRDDVDKLLEVDDYEDPFLEMDEFNYAPPRSHTGGKWKPGSLSIRTSPMLWQNQTWDTLLDYKNHDEEGKGRAETLIESPTETGERMKDSKCSSIIPTGGKWKPSAPPASHTGGKWKPLTPPATHTGGKWKPSEIPHRSKKSYQEMLSPDEEDHNSECESRQGAEPPATHTGGKWKPSSSLNHVNEPEETISNKSKEELPVTGKTYSGKYFRCSKTSGGTVQYHCLPCNRKLSSKQMYKSHIQTDLHCRRVLQESDLEYDSRVVKLYQQTKSREREPGKRVIKKPDMYNADTVSKKEMDSLPTIRMRGKRVSKREIIRCDVCKIKLPAHQLGKHLVSYYHSRRMKPNDPDQQELILKNIHGIVKQAPYQCGICKFYCNTHAMFKKHWTLPIHKEMEYLHEQKHRFWCAFCSYECETAKSMELHLDSNSHREVIWAVNKSMPIIIRHKVIFTCKMCGKEFRYKREWSYHLQHRHNQSPEDDQTDRFVCSICQHVCKGLKSLQIHVISVHKNGATVPYFCRFCDEYFTTALEAKNHRNGQIHKYRRNLSREGKTPAKGLSRTCFYCLETLENIEELKSHFIEKHPEHRPRCIKCGKVFVLSQEVSQHVKNSKCDFPQTTDPSRMLTGSNDHLVCEMCTFSTIYKSEMLLHVAIHKKKDKSKLIPCPLCKTPFTQTVLRHHLRTHLSEAVYKCTICQRGFVRKDRYVSHLKKRHCIKKTHDPFQMEGPDNDDKRSGETSKDEDEAEDENKKRSKRQKCGDPNCRYVPEDSVDWENHRLTHIGPKVYKCTECDYKTMTKTILKRHLLIHADSRTFPCPHCSFKAKMRAALKRHLKTHSFAKPYKCPYCSHTCNILENLRKHVLNTKQHAGKMLFECKICGFGTNSSKHFIAHYSENHQSEAKDMKEEAYIAAGLYDREDKSSSNSNTVRIRPQKAQNSKKKTSSVSDKDLLPYTKKYCPIAPRTRGKSKKEKDSDDEHEKPELTFKVSRDKGVGTMPIPKSYPSPSEKNSVATKEVNTVMTQTEELEKDDVWVTETQDNQVYLVNVVPKEGGGETEGVAENGNAVVYEPEQPCPYPYVVYEPEQPCPYPYVVYEPEQPCPYPYVVCETAQTVIPVDQMQYYVLGHWQLVENQGWTYFV